jgi:hypothetical protein
MSGGRAVRRYGGKIIVAFYRRTAYCLAVAREE